MAKESIVFSPEIPDRELDREVGKIDKKLGGVNDSIEPNIEDIDMPDIKGPGMSGVRSRKDREGGDKDRLQLAMLSIQERTLSWQKMSAQEDQKLNKLVDRAAGHLADIKTNLPKAGGPSGKGAPGMPDDSGSIGGVESKLGGLDSKLGNKLPSPIPGRLAPAAMPIAIAGAVGAGMLKAMHGASARLKTSTSLLGQAWNNVWRPLGDRLDELFIRDAVMDLLSATQDFEETFREGHEGAAFAGLTGDLLDMLGLKELGGAFNLGSLFLEHFPFDTIKTLIKKKWPGWPDLKGLWPGWPKIKSMWPGWPDLKGLWPGWGSFIDGIQWNTHIAGLRFSHWKQLITEPNWGGIIEGVTSSDVLGRIAPNVNGRQLVRSIGWPNIGPGHVIGSINWPSINRDAILGALGIPGFDEPSPPSGNPPGPTDHEQTSDDELFNADANRRSSPSTRNRGRNRRGSGALMQSGGVLNRGTTITAGEAGPEAIVPFAQLRRMIENAIQAGAQSGDGGGSSEQQMRRLESKFDELIRETRKVRRDLPQLEGVSDEGIARVVDEGRKNRVSDTNPLV